MNLEFFLNLFDKPLYKLCEIHRPYGCLPYSRGKIYKDLKVGEFPEGINIAGAGRVWTKQMLAEEMYRRYLLENKKVAQSGCRGLGAGPKEGLSCQQYNVSSRYDTAKTKVKRKPISVLSKGREPC